MKRVARRQKEPKGWIGELAFLQPRGQVRPPVKEALQFSGRVSAAQRGTQRDAWRVLWVELQLSKDNEQSYRVRTMCRGSTSGFR